MSSTPAQSFRSAQFSARFSNLEKIRLFVAQAAKACGLNEAGVYAVQLAVDEAFTNIIEHAYRGETDELVSCTCELSDTGITITLQDWGYSFDPEDVPAPDLSSNLEERTAGGLGLFFMRSMMDEVHFQFIPGAPAHPGSNILVMTKRKESHP